MVDVQKRTNAHSRPAGSSLKILIVDDDPDMRAYVRQCLGFLADRIAEVMEADDGMEALSLARRVKLDLVITDVIMPRLDGYELSRMLKKLPTASPIKVLAISGQTNANREQLASIDAFLDKPFNAERLQGCLEELLSHSL